MPDLLSDSVFFAFGCGDSYMLEAMLEDLKEESMISSPVTVWSSMCSSIKCSPSTPSTEILCLLKSKLPLSKFGMLHLSDKDSSYLALASTSMLKEGLFSGEIGGFFFWPLISLPPFFMMPGGLLLYSAVLCTRLVNGIISVSSLN